MFPNPPLSKTGEGGPPASWRVVEGAHSARNPAMTLRLKLWVMLLVVTKPKRRRRVPSAVSRAAARCHHCMTRSADCGTAGTAFQSAST